MVRSTFGSIWLQRSITERAPKSGAHACHLVTEVGGGERDSLARLRARHDDDVVVRATVESEAVLRPVQARIREPARSRHGGIGQSAAGIGTDLEVLPYR